MHRPGPPAHQAGLAARLLLAAPNLTQLSDQTRHADPRPANPGRCGATTAKPSGASTPALTKSVPRREARLVHTGLITGPPWHEPGATAELGENSNIPRVS